MSDRNNDGYYLDEYGDRIQELLYRHFIVPTIDNIPNEDTLSWVDNGNTVIFRIGESVRVIEDGVIYFYTLKDIKNSKAEWEKSFPKQDIIRDLETIRENASKGATALQEHQSLKTINGESIVGSGNIVIESGPGEGVATEEYVDNAVAEINVKGEDGYVYSNGEKVDMRFTRSLLPVGTSIPAKANLNTITYLKIGKYYCSLNVDAQTITNCPTSEAFSMEVFNPLGVNVDDETTKAYTYRVRVLTAYKTGMQYIQYCATSGTAGSWTYNSWRVVPQTSFAIASDKNGGSAVKGGSTRGVYIDASGTFQQMGYTIAKSVPSNAVFTDTNTKVTSVDNHYTPAEDADAAINAIEGEVVVGLKRDAAGHVVGVVSSSCLSDTADKVNTIEQTINALVGGNTSEAIDSFNEIIAFLEGVEDSENLDNIIASIEQQIASKQPSIDDINDIRQGALLGSTALQSIPSNYATTSYVDDKINEAISASVVEILNTPV